MGVPRDEGMVALLARVVQYVVRVAFKLLAVVYWAACALAILFIPVGFGLLFTGHLAVGFCMLAAGNLGLRGLGIINKH
jgi:hypothetical protein